MSLTAEERLITIRVKIKRAKKHIAELEAATKKYRDSYNHVAVGDRSLRKLPIIHFEMLAIAGDVLHNLRSALDHVMYHLALVADPDASEAVLRRISFPIGDSPHSYKSLRGKMERIVEPRALQFIDGLKPYKGGNDSLWKLHETNNIDKHRRLIAIGTDILCEGEGFDGYYLLKADNPSFATVDNSEREKNPNLAGLKSPIYHQAHKSEALIPALHQLTEIVASLVEEFNVFLAKQA